VQTHRIQEVAVDPEPNERPGERTGDFSLAVTKVVVIDMLGEEGSNRHGDQQITKFAGTLAWVLEEALQRYNEATRAAEIALRELGTTIDAAREHFGALKAQFEKNTIKLRDGTSVYYDTQTSTLVKQDEAGNWLTLENEDEIQQALTAAAENGGLMTTKQGKLALDNYEREIAYGTAFHADRRNLIAVIDDAVDKEAMPLDEAAQFKEDIAESMNDARERILRLGEEVGSNMAPVNLNEKEAFKVTTKNALGMSAASQKLSHTFHNLFSPDDPDEPSQGSDRQSPTPADQFSP
jgi:hypothetical protein